MTRRLHPLFFDTKDITLEALTDYATGLCEQARDHNFQLGDAVRKAKAMLGDNWSQAFPEWASVGHLERCEAVAKAFPKREQRNLSATWSIHRNHTNDPDRIERVQAHVDAGRTSDEARQANKEERAQSHLWLLAFDIHYFAHRHYYSGAGVETAMQVAEWVQRTVERLRAKGATDCLCAFEGRGSFRRELTEGDEWSEHRYKGNRGPKPDDLKHQLQLVRELLEGFGFCCMSADGYEADDCLASAAKQFPGKTTIISADKDLKSALSDRCNMLTDVIWAEDEHTSEMIPEYQWYTAKMLKEETGLTPEQWTCAQMLMGDASDCVAGAPGIGDAGAKALVAKFGSAAAAIQAAKDGDQSLLSMKRGKLMAKSLLEFEAKAEVTRQLVQLRDDLELPKDTRV